MVPPSFDSVASRVLRFPRVASREARARVTAMFAAETSFSPAVAPVSRSSRSARMTPANSRYFLRSSRRQQD